MHYFHFHVLLSFILMLSELIRLHQSSHSSHSSILLPPISHSLYCHLNTIPLCFFLRSKRLSCLSQTYPAYTPSSQLTLPHLSGSLCFPATYILTLAPLLHTSYFALSTCSLLTPHTLLHSVTLLITYHLTSMLSLKPLPHLQNKLIPLLLATPYSLHLVTPQLICPNLFQLETLPSS